MIHSKYALAPQSECSTYMSEAVLPNEINPRFVI